MGSQLLGGGDRGATREVYSRLGFVVTKTTRLDIAASQKAKSSVNFNLTDLFLLRFIIKINVGISFLNRFNYVVHSFYFVSVQSLVNF